MIDAMKMALEALDMACAKYGDVGNIHTDWGKWDAAGTALRQAISEAALNGLAETSREIEQWDTSDMAHRAGGLSVEQLAHDQVTYGMRITLGGKRVDPASIYKERVSIKQENIDTKAGCVDGVDIEPVAWQVMVEDEPMKEFSIKEAAHDWAITEKRNGSNYSYWIRPLYASPPKREWQSLTDNEINGLDYSGTRINFVRAIEQRLKEKNNG